MQWEKLGHIFDTGQHGLLFAQSPQALVFDQYVRIYFSTRQSDNGKFISHIAYVDYDKNFSQIINRSQGVVIPPGKLGCYDEHGIFPMNVVRVNGTIYGYISGWTRRKSVSVDTGIGLAVSNDDGLTFQRIGEGPVLTSSLHEPYLVGDPFVQHLNGKFHMWYIYGTDWKVYDGSAQPDRTYKIGHAHSEDGVNWVKSNRQIISDKFTDESQALPTVTYLNGQYHMYFCYRQSSDFRTNSSRSYRLGYAYSNDLVNWVRDDEAAGIDTTPGSWDSDMMCYPHIFHVDGRTYLLYNGNEFGRNGFGIARLKGAE